MNTTTYTPQQLTREARNAVAQFKRTLPACLRKGARFDGWELILSYHGPTLVAYFKDEAGRHAVNVAI